MTLSAAVGSFTRPTAASTDSVITGLGFRPTCVIFLPSHVTSANFWRAGAYAQALALAEQAEYSARVTGAGIRISGNDANASPSAFVSQSNFLDIGPGASLAFALGEDIDLESDGFRVNWAADSYDTEQEHIAYLALGGDIDARGLVFEWPSGLSAGQQFSVALNLPFTPSALIVSSGAGNTSQLNSASFGVVDSVLDQWCITQAADRLADPSNSYRRQSTQRAVHAIDPTNGSERAALKVVAMTSRGVTFECISNNGTTPPYLAITAIGGALCDAGTFAKSTSSAPASQTISTVGTPKAVLFAGVSHTSDNSTQDHIRLSFGVSDGASHRAIAWQFEDNAATSNSDTLFRNDAAFVKHNNATPTEEARATVASFAAGQINVSINPNDGVASRFGYLTFAEYIPLSGQAHITFGSVGQTARLADSHPLTGHALIKVGNPAQPAWLGSSSIGTHLLTGAASITFSGDDPQLQLDHEGLLTAAETDKPTLRFSTSHFWEAQDHPLTGSASFGFTTNTPALGTIGADLSGHAAIKIGNPEQKANLTVGHALKGAAKLTFTTLSLGLGGAALPEPVMLGPDDIPGTVNLFRTPSFEGVELPTSDVDAIGAASVALSSAAPWHGTSHLRVSLGTGSDRGVSLNSLRGLPYTARPYGFLAQFRARASGALNAVAMSTVHYTDSTSDDGNPVAVALTTAYAPVYVPVVVSDPAKQVDYIATTLVAALATGQTIDIDGVQQELDRGYGHTAWAIGTFGEPYHRWWAGAHLSITVRDGIPLSTQVVAESGRYEIRAQLFRADANNHHIECLSKYVINGAVTMDTERDVSWTFECEMTKEGYRKLRPFVDWLAPVMTVTKPDGSVSEGQLGHFVVFPSPREVDEFDERVMIDARSPETLLKMQGTKGYMFIREGAQLDHAMRVILRECHLGEDPFGKPRFDIPNTRRDAGRDMTWDKKEDALQILNDVAKKAHFHPIFATKTGVLKTIDRRDRRLKHQTPVRVWEANVPGKPHDKPSEVVGVVKLTPDLGKWDDNKIVVVSVNPRKGKIRAVRYITDPDNPVNPAKRGRIKERRVTMDVHRNEDAYALAQTIAEEIGTQLETVELSVIPDPATEFTRETVYLAIFNTSEEPVAVGHFAVHSVTWGWTTEEFLQTMRLGFIQSTEELQNYDPTEWEISGQWEPV